MRGGSPTPISVFGGPDGVVDVARSGLIIPGLNLQSVLHVGFWNVLSRSEDHRLPHISDELSRLRMDMVGLFETRRPGSGKANSKCFTYY